MAALTPDENCGECLDKINFFAFENAAGYHQGRVMPSTTDGTPMGNNETMLKEVSVSADDAGDGRVDGRRHLREGAPLQHLPAGGGHSDDSRWSFVVSTSLILSDHTPFYS